MESQILGVVPADPKSFLFPLLIDESIDITPSTWSTISEYLNTSCQEVRRNEEDFVKRYLKLILIFYGTLFLVVCPIGIASVIFGILRNLLVMWILLGIIIVITCIPSIIVVALLIKSRHRDPQILVSIVQAGLATMDLEEDIDLQLIYTQDVNGMGKLVLEISRGMKEESGLHNSQSDHSETLLREPEMLSDHHEHN